MRDTEHSNEALLQPQHCAPWSHWARWVSSGKRSSLVLQTQSEIILAPTKSVVVCSGHAKQDCELFACRVWL